MHRRGIGRIRIPIDLVVEHQSTRCMQHFDEARWIDEQDE